LAITAGAETGIVLMAAIWASIASQPQISPLSGLGRAVANTVATLKRRLSDRYRPELHYMRGPGPKWHERHPSAN
jgi:hypothetical protein